MKETLEVNDLCKRCGSVVALEGVVGAGVGLIAVRDVLRLARSRR